MLHLYLQKLNTEMGIANKEKETNSVSSKEHSYHLLQDDKSLQDINALKTNFRLLKHNRSYHWEFESSAFLDTLNDF